MEPLSLIASAFLAQAEAFVEGEFLQYRQPINHLTLVRTIFQGDCPGESVTPIKNLSFLAPAPPGGRQRIVVRNQRTGGFTNREYNEGRNRSESFWISIGNRQHGSFLSVQPGENRFTWSVQNPVDRSLPTEGEAWLDISIDERTRYRDFRSINEDAYCTGEKYNTWNRTPLDRCPGRSYVEEREGVCPDGTKVQLGRRTIYRRYSYW